MNEIWDDNQDEGYEEEAEPVSEFSYLENEVVRRIEKAKLYEAILRADLFSEGSAHPDIVEEVRAEFKRFSVQRIEVLLGIRQQGDESLQAPSPFSDDEVAALKAVAGRMIATKRTPQAPAEVASQVQQQQAPRVQTISARPAIQQQAPRPMQRPAKKPQGQAPRVRRQKSNNLSSTGQDLSQASNPNAVPMPSNDMMNAHISAQASRTRQANNPGGSSAEDQLLQLAIGISQNKNKNVRED